ncbi:hypothetical protein H0H87_007794 [Tephrocybe sp. NHM501043]|nr:hypothetical protein H0H87_007794 [Tephrocybe sp. NHM501043]
MEALKWTKPDYFRKKEDEVALQHAIARYHADDKVGEGKLSTSFDATCVAWKERFGIPYMHCGCPVPGKTIGRRLSNLIATTSTSRAQSPPYLIPLDRPDLLSSTHPSDHNSVVFIGNESRGHRGLRRKFRPSGK